MIFFPGGAVQGQLDQKIQTNWQENIYNCYKNLNNNKMRKSSLHITQHKRLMPLRSIYIDTYISMLRIMHFVPDSAHPNPPSVDFLYAGNVICHRI